MKKILNLNITFKMLILIIYSLLLLAISGIIVGSVLSEDETKGFGTIGKDEYISVVARLYETRNEISEKERASWNISYQIAQQDPSVKIQNVRIFTEGITMDDKKIFFEGSKKDSNSIKQEVCTTSKAFSSYSSITKSYSTSSKSNGELKIVYTRVLYQVVKDETTINKELKFRFVPQKPENENFNNYTQLTQAICYDDKVQNINLNDSNKYLNLDVVFKQVGEGNGDNPYKDSIKLSISANEKEISVANLYASNVAVTVFGKVENQATDPDNYFSEYITLFEIHGALVDLNSDKWSESQKEGLTDFYSTSSTLSKDYNVSELYIIYTLTTSNGASTTIRSRVNLLK